MAFLNVIIPVYNAKRYLQEAVASVLHQPCKDIHIVLVDDGSTDGSGEMCDEIAARENRVLVVHQNNQGVSVARNKGIEIALERSSGAKRKEYIAFLDADDLWCPNIITGAHIADIDRYSPDIIGFSTLSANEKATCFRTIHQYKAEKNLELKQKPERVHLGGVFAAHFYCLELFNKYHLRFMSGLKANEDVIFSMQVLFCARSLVFLPDYLYIYRTNSASVTHTKRYTFEHAGSIADAWYEASDWAHTNDIGAEEEKIWWRDKCREYSSTILVEMAGLLAESGCRKADIETFLRAQKSYEGIYEIAVDVNAPWQQELIAFRNDFLQFYRQYRKNGITKKAVKFVLKMPLLRRIYEERKYPLREIPNQIG